MAREIKLTKDTTGPNGKPWNTLRTYIVSDELAAEWVAEGKANYHNSQELSEAIKQVTKKSKTNK